MRAQIQKWGNSLALRIPKALAAEVKIGQGAVVDLTLIEGQLVIKPVRDTSFTLEHLLAGVTDQNLHGEVPTGKPAGRETW
ncbi:MAG TPA: AbrB/MazE/SpoVT family DNA-binding domain-containing protein [Isosphaeraceae bacterium]|jgi:antitoxin MazE|nr:AbrB/MazE/SpoVT family DNA-binding domain-containing protein [Isosphaeraceae bacterium]